MNLQKINKKIEKQKNKLSDLFRMRDGMLKMQELKAQDPEVTATRKKKKRKKGEEEEKTPEQLAVEKQAEIRYSYMRVNPIFYSERKSLKEFLAPDGIDPNNYGHLKLIDGGRTVYVRSYYIDKMPRDANFASTFNTLYNFPYVTSNTRIEPVPAERAVKLFDRQVWNLDTELASATKATDRNRARKIGQKMSETESWAREMESGRNALFNVSFLFTTFSKSADDMERIGSDFHNRGLAKNIGLVSSFATEPEAYKSAFPLNKRFKSKWGPVSTDCVKVHQMDAYSLSTIFNHTRSSFYHKNGVYLGRDMNTGRPITIDFYDQSLEAHNVIVCGATGTGKSATIKEILSRASDFGMKFCTIDTEEKGKRGEYSILTERLGGINYQITANSTIIMNPFELGEEMEYDEGTGREETALHLTEKIAILKGLLMAMIKFGKKEPDFADETAMDSILEEVLAHLFEIRGIVDGDPASLYVTQSDYSSEKKELPTIHEFYVEILKRRRDNTEPLHDKAYSLIVDGMKSFVRELYYVPGSGIELSRQEYEDLKPDEEGRRFYTDKNGNQTMVVAVRGVRAYYDGQSSLVANLETPATNIDVSQLPKNDRPLAMVIAANWINENIIKRNSANPKRISKYAVLLDEAHRAWKYKELRVFFEDLYRSARKRFIVPIVSTQALADFKGYPETEAIVKQSPIIFLFRQARQDQEYLESATCLTPAQMNRMLSLGGKTKDDGSVAEKGQVCLIVNDRVTFVQVDYLKNTEIEIVETNPAVIYEHIKKRRERAYAGRKEYTGRQQAYR